MSETTIGTALSAQRQKLGIGKGQAAEMIGMSRTTYSSYERDTQRPSIDVFPALAEFLNVTTEELLVLYGATSIVVVRSSLASVESTSDISPVQPEEPDISPVQPGESAVADSDRGEEEFPAWLQPPVPPVIPVTPVLPAPLEESLPSRVSTVKDAPKENKKKKKKRKKKK